MENSKQNDMFQIKNLIKEFNNNIIQIIFSNTRNNSSSK